MSSFKSIGGECLSLMNKLWDSYVVQARESNHAVRRKGLSAAGRLGSWRRWHREKQVVLLLPMVDRIAKNVRWMFAIYLDFRDLTQAGCVGLTSAANSYKPEKGAFEPYAYFRVRGAIIDSQKRRTYREERNVSLQGIAEAHNGWLPPSLDTDLSPRVDEIVEREQIMERLRNAIRALPDPERTVLDRQLAGQSLVATAQELGRSVTWIREKLAEARELVGVAVRGE